MQSVETTQKTGKHAPLYIRWNPQSTPYIIEFKLELVAGLSAAIQQASERATETGGILFGNFQTNPNPLIRIDNARLIPPAAETGQAYILSPKQYEEFVRIDNRAPQKNSGPIGVFRSHRRASTPRPSLADWSLLSSIFPRGPALFLLVQAEASDLASLFLREDMALPKQPAVAPFHFDLQELGGLPELGDAQEAGEASLLRSGKAPWIGAAVLAVSIGFAAYAWSGVPLTLPFETAPNDPHLEVNGDKSLTIGWNHKSPLVEQSSSAKLLIVEGSNAREITLGADELKFGSVDYVRGGNSHNVQVMLVLTMPGDFSVTQSVAWVG